MKSISLLLLFLIVCAKLQGQDKRVNLSGVVVDSISREPISDVHVQAGERGTTTNREGAFSISASINDAIVFSHINYQRRLLLCSSLDVESVVIVSMHEEAELLNEVMIRYAMPEAELKSLILSTETVTSREEQSARDNSQMINQLGRIAPPPAPTLSELYFQSLTDKGDVTIFSTNGNKGILKLIRDANRPKETPRPASKRYRSSPQKVTPFVVKLDSANVKDSVRLILPDSVAYKAPLRKN